MSKQEPGGCTSMYACPNVSGSSFILSNICRAAADELHTSGMSNPSTDKDANRSCTQDAATDEQEEPVLPEVLYILLHTSTY